MNKRQWQVLAVGVLAAILVPALATRQPNPPLIGPPVLHPSGDISVYIVDAITPRWAVFASISLANLTAIALLKCRSLSDSLPSSPSDSLPFSEGEGRGGGS